MIIRMIYYLVTMRQLKLRNEQFVLLKIYGTCKSQFVRWEIDGLKSRVLRRKNQLHVS